MKLISTIAAQIIVFAFILFSAVSCNKDSDQLPDPTDNTQDSIPDFRADYSGTFECEIYHVYQDSAGVYVTDTFPDRLVSIGLYGDSSIWLDSPYKSQEEFYVGNNTFRCLDCPAPQDYTQFYSPDSIFIMEKDSQMNTRYYWGHKI